MKCDDPTDMLLTFASSQIEKHGLKKTVWVVLAMGAAISFVVYTFPPIFAAFGDIGAFEIRDAHARFDD